MKNGAIVFGTLFAVFLIMMIPLVNAVEYQIVDEKPNSFLYTNQEKYNNIILKMLFGFKTESLDIHLALIYAIISGMITVLSYYLTIRALKNNHLFCAFIWFINFILNAMWTIQYIRLLLPVMNEFYKM